MAINILSLSHISKQFGEFQLLQQVSLTVPAGVLVAICGESGSGKSTLLRIMAMVEEADAGAVDWHEDFVAAKRYVPQEPELLQEFSVLDNCMLHGLLAGQQNSEKAARLLQTVGLAQRTFCLLPRQLSGGQARRLALAQALYSEPCIIFIDEPTSNLDAQTASDIRALLTTCIENGMTLVVATHDQQLIQQADIIYNLPAK